MTDDRSEDATYENENSTVTIPLREYDKLRERQSYITDKSLIGIIAVSYTHLTLPTNREV